MSFSDNFEIVRITENLYNEVEQLFVKVFVEHENLCIATNLPASKSAVDDIKLLLRIVLDYGLSFAAKDRNNGRIAGICCSHVIIPSEQLSLDAFMKDGKSEEMENIMQLLALVESRYDIFEKWHLDAVLEIEFLAVGTAYGRCGLATTLTEHTIDFARRMLHDELSPQEKQQLPALVRNARPKAVTAIFTSLYTQKIGKKLRFETLAQVLYRDYCFKGNAYGEKIDAMHRSADYAALKL